jgi:hypothetical protein
MALGLVVETVEGWPEGLAAVMAEGWAEEWVVGWVAGTAVIPEVDWRGAGRRRWWRSRRLDSVVGTAREKRLRIAAA